MTINLFSALKHSALAVYRKLIINFIDSEDLQPDMQKECNLFEKYIIYVRTLNSIWFKHHQRCR